MNSTLKSIPTTRVCVEICLSASSTASVKEIKEKATGIIDKAYRGGIYQPGSITSLFRKGGEKKIEAEDADVMYLSRHIQTARICDIEVAIASSDFIQTDGSRSNPSDISSSTKSSSSRSSSSSSYSSSSSSSTDASTFY